MVKVYMKYNNTEKSKNGGEDVRENLRKKLKPYWIIAKWGEEN